MDRPIGERVASLETSVTGLGRDVDSLRSTRNEHANYLQGLLLRVDSLEGVQEHMTTKLIPDVMETLNGFIRQLEEMKIRLEVGKTDFGWLVKILAGVYAIANSVAIGVLIWLATNGR